MSYEPFEVESFPGLDLQSDSTDTTGALDANNVDLSHPGWLRNRNGHESFATDSDQFFVLQPYTSGDGTRQLVGGMKTGSVEAFGTDGTSVASSSFNSTRAMCQYGTPSGTFIYAANRTGTIKRWDGSAWSSPTGFTSPATIDAGAITVEPRANRLVAANVSTNSSRVFFSDAGDAETFTYDAGPPEAGNFVDLTPGDGEEINAAVTWRDLVFVFKPTKFFVFYGESQNSVGDPIFEYQTIDVGLGAITPWAAVAAPDGVYFLSWRGVWRTTGDTPVRVSAPIEPWLEGTSLPYFGAPAIDQTSIGFAVLTYADDKLFLTVPDATNRTTFVLYLTTGQWARWSFSAGAIAFCEFQVDDNVNDVMFSETGTTGQIRHMSPSLSTDSGSNLSWLYRSGWLDLGVPDREKVIRQSSITGTGTVTLDRFRDFQTSDSGSASVALGSTLYTGLHRVAWMGLRMSYKLSGTGAMSVRNLTHDVAFVRPVGARSIA